MIEQKALTENHFTPFQSSISDYTLPERFTFPFFYEPHPLCILAAKELQAYLADSTRWKEDMSVVLEKENMNPGKMFGVLLVRNKENEIGYISAFSGKIGDRNHYSKFVPPVFNTLNFQEYKEGEIGLGVINREVERLEQAPDYLASLDFLQKENETADAELDAQRIKNRAGKKDRKIRRIKEKEILNEEQFEKLLEELRKISIRESYELKKLNKYWKNRIKEQQLKVDAFKSKINNLKEERKNKSGKLQQRLFEQYQFLNQKGESKNLSEIFQEHPLISGAGECAAPKLLQYAFKHEMKPLAMAEFWWGKSTKTIIRKHLNYYPACIGKCKPILTHMLDGMPMDENPMLQNPAKGKTIATIYEDEHLLVVNKPAEFLSVPGRYIKDSVANRMKAKFPEATGPLVVHRLDMSTSGLMLIAKNLEVYKYLQHQFIKRTVKKRYVAILDGVVEQKEGVIDLPLHIDWNNRPRQMVCYEFGKSAQTKYKVIDCNNGLTRIHFFPITGRTHQLRVHAAHPLGLNLPIVGDDLYGVKNDRLCLHAEWIEFEHPHTKERMSVEVEAEF